MVHKLHLCKLHIVYCSLYDGLLERMVEKPQQSSIIIMLSRKKKSNFWRFFKVSSKFHHQSDNHKITFEGT